nr:cytochrome c biogenesis protein [Candidatus Pantoea persica]
MLTAIAAAFLGGLILNLMPCVFPVISLKALSLIRHHDRPAQARSEGIAFLAGVVVTMLLLAARRWAGDSSHSRRW